MLAPAATSSIPHSRVSELQPWPCTALRLGAAGMLAKSFDLDGFLDLVGQLSAAKLARHGPCVPASSPRGASRPLMNPDPPCSCDLATRRFCEEARGLLADLERAAVAGAPGPGVTTELGAASYRRAFGQFQHHLRVAREFHRRRE